MGQNSYLLCSSLEDVLVGHDVNDSTTVTNKLPTFHLPDEISVDKLHIGIPKVAI